MRLGIIVFIVSLLLSQQSIFGTPPGNIEMKWSVVEKSISFSDSKGTFAVVGIDQAESFFETETGSGKFANISTGDGKQHTFEIEKQSPFVVYRYRDSAKPAELRFSGIELTSSKKAKDLKALGTVGLRAVNGHKGSYAFLAIADPETRSGLVGGWRSNRIGSGIVFSGIGVNGNAVMIPEMQFGRHPDREETEYDAFIFGRFDDCLEGLESLADEIAKEHDIKLKSARSGYCTWYSNKYGGACDEVHLAELADAAEKKLSPYGFDFIQIDDKWQIGETKNGPKKNFTTHNSNGPYKNGMKAAADNLKSHGMESGIWFIPFAGSVVDPHFPKEWFVKSGVTDETDEQGKSKRHFSKIVNKEGEPYEANWGGTSLDLTRDDVQEYLFGITRRIAVDWGYDYFKLDGIWMGMGIDQLYINNEYKPDDLGQSVFHDMTKTPIEVYRMGYDTIRKAAPDVFILGCNVSQNMRTMAGSYGVVDAMRIGPDNGPSWSSLQRGTWTGSNRYFYNGRVWWNDPDPVYVRDSMPIEHARLLASWVALSGQLYAFSDWLPELSEERVEILRRTMKSHALKTARPIDLFENDKPRIWHLWDEKNGTRRDVIGFYNWNEKEPITIETSSKALGLPESEAYVGFDYWSNQPIPEFSGELKIEIPAGSCRIIAVSSLSDRPVLLGTSAHVTQGIVDIIEEKWNPGTKTYSGKSHMVEGDAYELRFYVKGEIVRKTVNPEKSGENEWSFDF